MRELLPKRRLLIIGAMLWAVLFASVSSLIMASPAAQGAQPLNIGVIGPVDGPTALGVTLAVRRISARGPFTVGGKNYTLGVVAASADAGKDVPAAIDRLKQSNVIAIFGPDEDAAAQDGFGALNGAGLPVFVPASSTTLKPGGLVFRSASADNWRMNALAEILIEAKKNKFALFQGGPAFAPAATEMVTALTKRGKAPAQNVILKPEGPIADAVKALKDTGADTIIAFGDATQAAELYRLLRASGFNGTFATPKAESTTFISSIPAPLREGIYGVSGWSYTWDTNDSADFTREYVATFGQVPASRSAAAYDAAVATLIVARTAGLDPKALGAALTKLPKSDSLQGIFNPSLGNNELTASVAVTISNRYGAPEITARYEGMERVRIAGAVAPTKEPPTPAPPTPTLEGVVLTGRGNTNVRVGPGTTYPIIGQIRLGEQFRIIGANRELSWVVIEFRQQQGWIEGRLVTITGDLRSVAVIAPPPTPIPTPTQAPTATTTPVPYADLALVSATLNPQIPQPGIPFSLTVVVKNQGQRDTGPFAVATSFLPGNVFASANVPNLAAGQQTTVNLNATVSGTGIHSVAIVLDLNNQLDEGPNGKANNKPELAYKIDRQITAQGTITINNGNNASFTGNPAPDVQWNGAQLAQMGAAKIGTLSGIQAGQIHYDLLTPDKVSNAPIPLGSLPAGALVEIYTTNGRRGYLRVTSSSAAAITVDYFIYGS